MWAAAMLAQVDTLPCSERELAIHDWNRQRHIGQHRPHMRRHVVRSLSGMRPRGIVLSDGPTKPRFEVVPCRWISVFLNRQACRCVLYEQNTYAVADAGIGHDRRCLRRHVPQPLARRLNSEHDRHSASAHAELTKVVPHILLGCLEKGAILLGLPHSRSTLLAHQLALVGAATTDAHQQETQNETHNSHVHDHLATPAQRQVAGVVATGGRCPCGPSAPALIQSVRV